MFATPLPLEGIRVVDLTMVIGPPYGTMLLADMGAEVIRVESCQYFQSTTRGRIARPPPEYLGAGDPVGSGYVDFDPGERPWNRFALFNCHARNKRAMTVDVTRPEGRAVLLQLVRIADAVVENNVPGTLEKLGIGYETLRRARADLVMISVSGMGQTAPYRHFRGFGFHFEDVLAHTWLRTYPDGVPSSAGAVPSDAAVGAGLVVAFIAALHYRHRTGEGQYIDLSMAENFIPHLAQAYLDYTFNGRVQTSPGNRSPDLAPQGAYRCAPEGGRDDSWIALSVDGEAAWQALCHVIGRPDLAADPRLASRAGRRAHQDVIDAAIEAWTRQRRAREAQEILQQAGVAAGALLDEAAAYADRHLQARGFFQEITGVETGTHLYPVQFFHASRTPETARRPPPRLGEDNAYVYRELLGFSAAEFRRFEAAGHIGMDYAPEIP